MIDALVASPGECDRTYQVAESAVPVTLIGSNAVELNRMLRQAGPSRRADAIYSYPDLGEFMDQITEAGLNPERILLEVVYEEEIAIGSIELNIKN